MANVGNHLFSKMLITMYGNLECTAGRKKAHEVRAYFALLVESELSQVKQALTTYYQLTNLFNNEVTIMGCKKPKKK